MFHEGTLCKRVCSNDFCSLHKFLGNKLHPTQKPICVLLPLINTFSVPDGLVLDPFSGSGSTLLAANMLGRDYLGIELDAKYHAIASRRLQQEQQPHVERLRNTPQDSGRLR